MDATTRYISSVQYPGYIAAYDCQVSRSNGVCTNPAFKTFAGQIGYVPAAALADYKCPLGGSLSGTICYTFDYAAPTCTGSGQVWTGSGCDCPAGQVWKDAQNRCASAVATTCTGTVLPVLPPNPDTLTAASIAAYQAAVAALRLDAGLPAVVWLPSDMIVADTFEQLDTAIVEVYMACGRPLPVLANDLPLTYATVLNLRALIAGAV